jgi:hypothetical protein
VIGSAVHPSAGRVELLALGFLPPEVHPDAEADESRRDERRRYDDSGQFNCVTIKFVSKIIKIYFKNIFSRST